MTKPTPPAYLPRLASNVEVVTLVADVLFDMLENGLKSAERTRHGGITVFVSLVKGSQFDCYVRYATEAPPVLVFSCPLRKIAAVYNELLHSLETDRVV